MINQELQRQSRRGSEVRKGKRWRQNSGYAETIGIIGWEMKVTWEAGTYQDNLNKQGPRA